jgi:hypothetical protein
MPELTLLIPRRPGTRLGRIVRERHMSAARRAGSGSFRVYLSV